MSQIVWVDLEMTGLNSDTDTILEMACIVTDADLNILAEGPDMCVHHSDEDLARMNTWCIETHGKSGLTDRVRRSTHTLAEVEESMIAFISKYVQKGVAPLAGNSVHVDQRFLVKYMPNFMSYLHYRIVDVSSVKELCKRWYPVESKSLPSKKGSHRALSDIQESIEELKYYRSSIFKSATLPPSTE